MISGGQTSARVHFQLPPADLAPYVAAFHHVEVGRGGPVEDFLHPEWANLRIRDRGEMSAVVGKGELQRAPPVVLAGPTSRATRFRIGPGRLWGIGLLPLGWAKFIGEDASRFADCFCDPRRDTACKVMAGAARGLFGEIPDLSAEAGRLASYLRGLADRPIRDEDAIVAVHAALVSGDVRTVAELGELTGFGTRTLERFCKRAFGFSPQILLRRQRFLRSLARAMLDPSLTWLSAIDDQYHDQAHFVRDFRQFMGMTPREYAAMPHPILSAATKDRKAIIGEAVQGLHEPTAAVA